MTNPKLILIALLLPVVLAGCVPAGAPERSSFPRPTTRREPPPETTQPPPDPFDLERLSSLDKLGSAMPSAEPPAHPSGNVMVVIESVVHTEGRDDLASAAWALSSGSVTAGGGGLAPQNGIVVAVGGNDFAAAFQAARKTYKSSEVTRQVITTLSGTEGTFFVGEEIPVARLVYWTFSGPVVLFESATIGRSLLVRPLLLQDGSIDLEVTPYFSELGRRGRSIRVQELSTRVILRHGQPMILGALQQSSDTLGRTLFAVRGQRRDQSLTIIVTPYLL